MKVASVYEKKFSRKLSYSLFAKAFMLIRPLVDIKDLTKDDAFNTTW